MASLFLEILQHFLITRQTHYHLCKISRGGKANHEKYHPRDSHLNTKEVYCYSTRSEANTPKYTGESVVFCCWAEPRLVMNFRPFRGIWSQQKCCFHSARMFDYCLMPVKARFFPQGMLLLWDLRFFSEISLLCLGIIFFPLLVWDSRCWHSCKKDPVRCPQMFLFCFKSFDLSVWSMERFWQWCSLWAMRPAGTWTLPFARKPQLLTHFGVCENKRFLLPQLDQLSSWNQILKTVNFWGEDIWKLTVQLQRCRSTIDWEQCYDEQLR